MVLKSKNGVKIDDYLKLTMKFGSKELKNT